jgi:hypothetical protein
LPSLARQLTGLPRTEMMRGRDVKESIKGARSGPSGGGWVCGSEQGWNPTIPVADGRVGRVDDVKQMVGVK